MNLEYIDIHSHLNLKKFEKDLDEVVKRMTDNKVGTICIGVDKETSVRAVRLADKYENVWACVGVHPTSARTDVHSDGDSKDEFDEIFFGKLVKNKKVVSVGECGLDYFRETKEDDKQKQKKLFVAQIDFAVKNDLPLMLHVRDFQGTEDAHRDTIEILKKKKEEHGEKLRGNSHFFTSSWEIAQKYFELDFTISITGIVTFSNDLNEVVKNAPLDMLHIETDSPYATPVPYRGKRNEPSFVVEIPKKIAKIRGMEEDEIRLKLLENTLKLFRLSA